MPTYKRVLKAVIRIQSGYAAGSKTREAAPRSRTLLAEVPQIYLLAIFGNLGLASTYGKSSRIE